MIGQTISHYKILEKLGQGGMGVVYKAQDTKLERLAALKFLPPHLAASEEDKARFVQEAKAAAALNHPNVCSIYDIQEHDGQMFIVMEYVEGQTLRDKKQNFSIKQVIDIGIQLADGLATAHEHGIVHRDIKPENIMVRKDGIVQIMDFGLAKLRGVSRLTKEGSTIGTVGYMSPEQVQGFDTDHRSDIFSLGVVLYELLAGQSPFQGVHETAIFYDIVNVDPAPVSSLRQEVDPALDAIILECLAKEPDDRYQSAKEVTKELKRFKRESS
ncbi:MAG: serine/threonine-protein kinase, partial [Bacteroidota bacterium]